MEVTAFNPSSKFQIQSNGYLSFLMPRFFKTVATSQPLPNDMIDLLNGTNFPPADHGCNVILYLNGNVYLHPDMNKCKGDSYSYGFGL